MFKKLMTNKEGQLSITNGVVLIFVALTAFKTLFSGVEVHNQWFSWKIDGLDTASTLPLLFSLLNYGHRRSTLANTVQTDKEQ